MIYIFKMISNTVTVCRKIVCPNKYDHYICSLWYKSFLPWYQGNFNIAFWHAFQIHAKLKKGSWPFAVESPSSATRIRVPAEISGSAFLHDFRDNLIPDAEITHPQGVGSRLNRSDWLSTGIKSSWTKKRKREKPGYTVVAKLSRPELQDFKQCANGPSPGSTVVATTPTGIKSPPGTPVPKKDFSLLTQKSQFQD